MSGQPLDVSIVGGSGYTGGGNANPLGYHIQGYQSRYDDKLTEWNASAFYQNQVSTNWELKTGLEFTYYHLDHFNQALFPLRTDKNVYKPWQGAAWFQNKLEFGGFIMNAGVRLDLYNPNSTVYSDLFDPVNGPTTKSKIFTQFSPRLGISHPIDENTVLRFSYGHFFERGPFGDFGEGRGNNAGSLTTFIIDGTNVPTVLGNRLLKPEKYDAKQEYPLVLFLHGAGERGEDLNLVKKHGPPKLVETLVVTSTERNEDREHQEQRLGDATS